MLFLFLIFSFFSFHCSGHIYREKTPVSKYLKKLEISSPCSGMELVDCIYVINLDKRPKKWQKMEKLLTDYNLFGHRVSAVNGWQLPLSTMQELAGSYPLRMTGGTIGCLLSHLSVLSDAYTRGFEIIWVLEDDVTFLEDPHQIPEWLKLLKEIDCEWDIFYTDRDARNENGIILHSLASDFRPDGKYHPIEFYLQRVEMGFGILKIGQRFGSHSMLISRKGMKKVLDYFTHVYLWTAYDIELHYIPNILEYAPVKDIVISFAFESDVHSDW